MRSPVPSNKIVVFTLAGAILTTVVAGALAVPGSGLVQTGEPADSDIGPQQAAGDAPEPNESFTPAVQTESAYEADEEYEEGDEDEADEEYEAGDEDEADEEYEAGDEDEADEEYE